MVVCKPDKNEFIFICIKQQVKELSDKRQKETSSLCSTDIAQLDIIFTTQDIQVIINSPCIEIFVFYEKEAGQN